MRYIRLHHFEVDVAVFAVLARRWLKTVFDWCMWSNWYGCCNGFIGHFNIWLQFYLRDQLMVILGRRRWGRSWFDFHSKNIKYYIKNFIETSNYLPIFQRMFLPVVWSHITVISYIWRHRWDFKWGLMLLQMTQLYKKVTCYNMTMSENIERTYQIAFVWRWIFTKLTHIYLRWYERWLSSNRRWGLLWMWCWNVRVSIF